MAAATVAEGVWHYDGTTDLPVRVVALSFDYWHAIADANGQLEPDQAPRPPGDGGRLYYVCFTQIDGPGFPSMAAAKVHAQSKVKVAIRWG